jgi:hypothetical protein
MADEAEVRADEVMAEVVRVRAYARVTWVMAEVVDAASRRLVI